jgi:DNA-binding transcriptional regulator GbsR (MarR family)
LGEGKVLARSLVRGENGSPETVAFEEAVVGFFLNAADMLGIPKSVAAIYGICFASPVPLGFTEISERLNVSSGSVSQGLRVLREVGALKVASLPSAMERIDAGDGKRREYFEPDLELRRLIGQFLEHRLDRQLDAGRANIREILTQVPLLPDESSALLTGRLVALKAWHDRAHALMPIIKAFLQLQDGRAVAN